MRTMCWSVMLAGWTCAATAAEVPPEPVPPVPAMSAPEAAAVSAEFGPEALPAACPGQCRPRPSWFGWWSNRLKPSLQYSHWGYCDQFEETPFGAQVRAHQRAQICSGWAARLWLYRYDFCDDGAGLNAAGHQRLTELAREFPVWSHHALAIESTSGKPQLDAARREHVARLLEESGVPAQVVIGVPAVSTPFGDEAREWNALFLRQVRSGGSPMGGSTAGVMSGAASGQPSAQ